MSNETKTNARSKTDGARNRRVPSWRMALVAALIAANVAMFGYTVSASAVSPVRGATTVEVSASTRPAGHPLTATQRHHLARLRNAAKVRAARRHRARAIAAAQRAMNARGGGSWHDWFTTDTPDWYCIHSLEEPGVAFPGNWFGWVPWPISDPSEAGQKALALSDLHRFGWKPWTTAPACGL